MNNIKNTIDYAQKNFNDANKIIKQAVDMESKDIPKAVQLYQEAEKKYRSVLCQHTATKLQIDKSNEMSMRCSQRINELMQFLTGNPSIQQQQQSPHELKRKTSSSATIVTPPSPNMHLNPNSKTISNNQILTPPAPQQTNIYQTQQQANIYQTQQQVNIYQAQQQANIYRTQQPSIQQQTSLHQTQQISSSQQLASTQQMPHPQQVTSTQQVPHPQQITSTQQVPHPQQVTSTQQVPAPQQNQAQVISQQPNPLAEQSSSDYQEGYNCLENGLIMDNDGFYDLAKYFYSKSISLFTNFLLTAGQINQNNIEFWIYQLKQRNEALDFYNTKSQDASSYYFNTSFRVLEEIKSLQTSDSEDAEVIQRKLNKFTFDCISLLKKCMITAQDQFLTNLAKNFLETKMKSNMKDYNDESFHKKYIVNIFPDPVNIFVSGKVKNEISSISHDSSKKFVLVYGPSGTKLNDLVQFAASSSSVKMIFEVNFMKFIGINANPVDILNEAFENAKQETPSYLLLSHIDACLKDEKEKDNLSIMICDFLTSHISSGLNGVTVVCTTNMPWKIPVSIFTKFDAKIYCPAPDESVIKEILRNSPITRRISDEQITSFANEFVGYTEFAIERVLIEAQIDNAVKSSGGLRNNICSDISEGFILRNEINIQDIIQAKTYIPPIVSQSGLIFFDQIENTAK